ncbi:MAG TPA: hydrogenase maturation nickel metallochaperone HypA [Polyangia bacterium]
MHELALTESVVRMVRERLGEARVVRVRVEVGRRMAVLPDAMRFCFDVCTRGTPLDGAVIEIDEVAARGRCRSCGAVLEIADALALCGCGSADVELAGGDELRIKEVEVV